MNMVVFVKQVPDSSAKVALDQGRITTGSAPLVINPWDEYALEAALRLKEAHGGDVTALTFGEAGSSEALKHALAMGADQAIRVDVPIATTLDTLAAAQLLVSAIRKLGQVDLAFFGRQAIDTDSGMTPAQTARLLGWPFLGLCATINLTGQTVRVERSLEEGRQIVSTQCPAVFTISKDFGEPRYPSFMGLRKAARAEIPVWALTDLGFELPPPLIQHIEWIQPPSRTVSCTMLTGTPAEIGAELANRIIAEALL